MSTSQPLLGDHDQPTPEVAAVLPAVGPRVPRRGRLDGSSDSVLTSTAGLMRRTRAGCWNLRHMSAAGEESGRG